MPLASIAVAIFVDLSRPMGHSGKTYKTHNVGSENKHGSMLYAKEVAAGWKIVVAPK